jgi:hypothetical protein
MSVAPDDKDPKTGRFKPGNTGAGGGRPKGSRNKIGEQFLTDLQADWDENGAEAIKACRTEKPADYVKMVASLLPKQIEVKRPEEELTDSELADLIDAIQADLSKASSAEPTHEGSDAAQ